MNVDYDYTDSENKRRSAYDALHDGKTVCQGYALLANKMLTTAGIENKIIGGNDHAWNLVNIDSKWYHLDCTWDDGENNTDYYKYYNLTDEKMAVDHVWDSSGTEKCQTNYITELQNQQDNPEMQEVLESIQESDVGVEDPNPSDGVTFMYNDILLKEGDSTDLFLDITAPDYLDSEIEWSSSDPTVVDIVYGTAVAKKAGAAFITAKFKNNPGYSDICSVKVIANNSDNGFTLKQLSEDNLSAFKNQEIKPVISMHSNDNINTNTVVSDCYSQLSDSIEMMGHPIDIKTDSKFDWAEIGFKVNDTFLDDNNLSDLIICWYDEENNVIVPQATKVDYDNNTVTAVVPHFSKYFLTYKSKVNKKQINIVGVIDTIYSSGSALDGYKSIIQNLMIVLK